MTQHILVLSNYLLKPIESLLDFLKSWNSYVKRQRVYKQTVKELSALSDYELNDIGIARGDIRSLARQDAEMKKTQVNSNLAGWV